MIILETVVSTATDAVPISIFNCAQNVPKISQAAAVASTPVSALVKPGCIIFNNVYLLLT